MAKVKRCNMLVISIAQILSWAKTDGPNSPEEQVHEQVSNVKALWLSFQAEHLEIVKLCEPDKIGFHTDATSRIMLKYYTWKPFKCYVIFSNLTAITFWNSVQMLSDI